MELLSLLLVALATSAVSMTITKAVVFRWLREAIEDRSPFFGELFSCPYCMAHWIGALLVLLCQLRVMPGTHIVLEMIVQIFAVVTIASWSSGLIFKSITTIADNDG